MRVTISVIVLLVMILNACDNNKSKKVAPGVDLSLMDNSVNPADDFFRYVNGKWLDSVEIPADRRRWGSFDELRKMTSDNTLESLNRAIENNSFKPGTDQAKAVLFYKAAMDTASINEAGLNPVMSELQKIDAISSMEELQTYLIESAPYQHGALFGFGVMADLNNSNRHAAYLVPGALGLPDRDFYMKDDTASTKIQEAYKLHVARMFGFLDYDPSSAKAVASDIYQLEKRLAAAMFTKEERRDLSLQNNPRSIDQVKELVPAINWDEYFGGIGMSVLDTVIVMQLKYMEALNAVLSSEPVETLKQYVKWSQFNQWSAYLSTDIERANFDFYYTQLEGIPEMKPRDESSLSVLNANLGEALGKLYVDDYFPPEAKSIALDMVNNLKEAFAMRIRNLDWMSDSTKQKALEKLDAFNVKIGYPDKWKDYSNLEISGPGDGGTYISNMINYWKWSWEEDLSKIGQPVDKTEWHLPPQVVNAYYSPLFNEIVFPAAILQPPFYNYQADAAVNFGGIGAVIGHEMSHGFDDKGSMFDKEGNLKNWWGDSDRERFKVRAQKLIDQFDAYEPFEGVFVNGTFTLGENIGDLGGVNIAYDGLQRHLAEHGDAGLIDGFTQDQRFFISWGTIWRTKMRDEALRNQIKTDPHTPGMYRAIGPLTNLTAFYNAFNVEEGDALWTPDSLRVHIW